MDRRKRQWRKTVPVTICWNCHNPVPPEAAKCEDCGAYPRPDK